MFRDRFSRMNKFRKRAFAVALATAVASTSFNIGSIAANAGTSARGRVIVAFEELPGDIVEQTLPIGGKKTDLNLPEELDVLLYSEEAEKEGRKKETVSKDRTDDAAETPTESPADEKQSEGATEAASEESQDSNTDTANTDTGSANDGSAVTPDSSRDGDTASEPTNETGTDGGSTDSQPAEGGDSAGETGEDTVDTSGRLTDRMLTAVGSTFIPVKAYAAEPATEESEEAESGVETQGDGAADTVHAVQTSANSASDTGADEAAVKGGKKTDEVSSVESETGSATEAASESPAGSSERTAADSSDDSKEKVTRLTDGERRTLEDVRWKLVRDKSEYGSRFQAIREGDVFYFAPDIKAYGLKSDVDLPEIKVTIVAAEDETASGNGISGNAISDNGVSDNSISGNTVSENSYPEFDQFMIVSGVKVSVTAPEGVFPEGAVLKVKRIDDAASNEKIEQAVKEDMGLSDAAEVNGVRPDGADSEAGDPDGSSASTGEALSYISFDITITDVSGNEIQPNTEYGKANVTFSQADIISEYIEAPGEETEGKLGTGNDGVEGATDSEGVRSFTLGGENAGETADLQKALRVYHFDDSYENAEVVDRQLDEGAGSVEVSAEHFSTWTIGVASTSPSCEAGDFIITASGVKCEVELGSSDVTIKPVPLASASDPKVTVKLRSGVSRTHQQLRLIANSSADVGEVNFVLDGVKSDAILQVFGFNEGSSSSIIKLNNTEFSYLRLEKAKCRLISADGTKNVFSSGIAVNGGEVETLYIGCEEGADPLTSTISASKIIMGVVSGDENDKIMIESGTVNVDTLANAYGKINITGGLVSILNESRSSEVNAFQTLDVSGGTVVLPTNIFNLSTITGGSVFYIDGDGKHFATQSVYIRLEGYPYAKITKISMIPDSHGLNDVYTDKDGEIGLSISASDPIEDNKKVKYIDAEVNGKTIRFVPSSKHPDSYAERGKKPSESETTNVFIPYNPITDLDFDPTEIPISETVNLYDFLKITGQDGTVVTGKSYTASPGNFSGEYSDGIPITNRYLAIKWTFPAETIESGDCSINYTSHDIHSTINYKSGIYRLTAEIPADDDTAWEGEERKWTFVIPKIIPVTDITMSPSTVYLDKGTTYTFDDDLLVLKSGTATVAEFKVVPSNSSIKKPAKWTVTDPDGTLTILNSTNKSYTPAKGGEYKFEALIENGQYGNSSGNDFKKTFTLISRQAITDSMITLDKTVWAYTGSEVRPAVTVKNGDVSLVEGEDYTLTYSNNVGKGTNTAAVTVTGIGNYTGAVEKKFSIADLPTATISIKTNDGVKTFSDLQTSDETAGYVNTATKAQITAKAPQGGTLTKTSYFIENKYYGTETELIKATGWTDLADPAGGDTTEINADGKYYVYVRATAGDASAYLSSQCVIYDATPPVKPVITDGTVSGTRGTVVVTGSDALSGIAKYYVMAVKKGSAAPTAAEVKAGGISSTSAAVTIPGLSYTQEYTFYAVTEDKAGNISAISDGKDSTVGKGSITGRISVMGHSYDKLQGKQETDDYTNETKEIKITGAADNGVAKIEYFITDKFYSSTSAIEGAAKETKGSGNAAFTVSNWATYNDSSRPYLLKNKLNYIYVKITDNGGYTEYISSKGIWEDEINPTTSSTSSTPKDTTAASTVKGTDKESGVKNYYLLVRKATDSAPSKAEDVKSAGMKSEDGKFSLTGLTANTKYTVYTVTEDRAGNLSAIKKTSFTTKKATDANADAAKKAAAAASAAASAAAAKGSGSNGTGGKGSNVAKRTASANGSGSVSDNADSGSSDGIRDGVPYIEDATDGILIGRENTSGWERIESEAGKASQPSQIHVDMNGSTVVPAAALRQCRDRDITYYFRLNDDIIWAVNGLSFTADPGDIDFRVRTDTRNIPSKLVNEVADVYPHTNLTIEHDGDFGFTAILSVNMGSDNEGMYANLYYYDEDNNALNFIDSTEVDGGGRASFEFLHASDYTVILRGDALTDKSAAALTDDNFMSTDDTSATSAGPVNVSRNTGSLWLVVVSVISFLLCGLILFMPDKRNRRRGPANAVS